MSNFRNWYTNEVSLAYSIRFYCANDRSGISKLHSVSNRRMKVWSSGFHMFSLLEANNFEQVLKSQNLLLSWHKRGYDENISSNKPKGWWKERILSTCKGLVPRKICIKCPVPLANHPQMFGTQELVSNRYHINLFVSRFAPVLELPSPALKLATPLLLLPLKYVQQSLRYWFSWIFFKAICEINRQFGFCGFEIPGFQAERFRFNLWFVSAQHFRIGKKANIAYLRDWFSFLQVILAWRKDCWQLNNIQMNSYC